MSENRFYENPEVPFEDVLKHYSKNKIDGLRDRESLLNWADKHYTQEQKEELVKILPSDEDIKKFHQTVSAAFKNLNKTLNLDGNVLAKALSNNLDRLGINTASGFASALALAAIPQEVIDDIKNRSLVPKEILEGYGSSSIGSALPDGFLDNVKKIGIPLNTDFAKPSDDLLRVSNVSEIVDGLREPAPSFITIPDDIKGRDEVDYYLVKPNGEIIGEVLIYKG